jgi:hypothetical protein
MRVLVPSLEKLIRWRKKHTVLIGTVETIKHCQNAGIEGALPWVDLHKAFDSVLHEFMREVYTFFGFGDYFISPSPRQFNMCQQICIFKIELDPGIKSVY